MGQNSTKGKIKCETKVEEGSLGQAPDTLSPLRKKGESFSTRRSLELCPTCGLCCNGVLFADVELQDSDDPKRLDAHGFLLQRKGRKLAFAQPCSCFDGKWCRAYADRPTQCRAFECGLLKRVQKGELTTAVALEKIKDTLRHVQAVRELLRRLGNSEEQLPLSRRYAQIMAQPIDLSAGDESVEFRAKLLLEVEQLMRILHQEFLGQNAQSNSPRRHSNPVTKCAAEPS